jgi:hypothetical protein
MICRSRRIVRLVFAAAFFSGCAAAEKIESAALLRDIDREAAALSANIEHAYKLRTKRVGKSGFYYLLERGGIVVFHPQAVLIGSNMSGMGFVQKILEQGNGCIAYGIDGKKIMLFFRLIDESNILCLSIPQDDVANFSGECSYAELGGKEVIDP